MDMIISSIIVLWEIPCAIMNAKIIAAITKKEIIMRDKAIGSKIRTTKILNMKTPKGISKN